MIQTADIKAIQTAVGVKVDGVFGPVTLAAVLAALDKSRGYSAVNETPAPDTSESTILRGDGTWPWNAWICGDDITVVGARATCFGGGDDPQDDGSTASGISTKLNPGIVACALPLAYSGPSLALKKALGGSPIPKVPWKTQVVVTRLSDGKEVTVELIDLGPAKYTGNAIDLTIAAARLFDPNASASNFELRCSYRILGAAKYASATIS